MIEMIWPKRQIQMYEMIETTWPEDQIQMWDIVCLSAKSKGICSTRSKWLKWLCQALNLYEQIDLS